MSAHHSFHASFIDSVGNYVLGEGSVFKPALVNFNYGSCYSTSTGRFTAAIKGVYCFKFSAFHNQSVSSISRPAIYKNGSHWMMVGHFLYTSGNEVDSIINLDIGDYVDIRSSTGPLYLYSAVAHNQFCGHLVAAL